MSLWRHFTHGVRRLLHPAAADQDVDDEVQHYFDEAVTAFVAKGLTPAEARRRARQEMGSTIAVREQVGAYGWEHAVGTLVADLRYAGRGLRRNPGFTAVVVVTLALGIGGSTAIFSSVNPILFEPLPYHGAGRIMAIWDYGVDNSRRDVTFGTHRELEERSRSFDAFAVMKRWQPTLTGSAEPERLEGQRVSGRYFRVLGVAPALGRDFDPSDDRVNGPRVVILAERLWRRRFGGDAAIVGREVTLDDALWLVVGVMPASFENVLEPSAELWSPLQYDPLLPPQGREWGHHLRMVGRLRSGVTNAQAKRELDAIASAPISQFPRVPWAALRQGLIVTSLQDDLVRAVKPALVAVLGAVMLVLVIACVNVTNLLLARSAQRRGEFAMRVALGAGATRLVRQMITESLLLAALGGALGVLAAHFGVGALVALSPAELPRAGAIRINGTVIAWAIAITAALGLVVGLIPALHACRRDMRTALQQAAPRTAGGHQVMRRTLVVVEVALALVLLVSAGLLLHSLQRLFAVSPGFTASRLLTMEVQTSGRRFDREATRRFFAQALEAVRRVPGVTAAAFTSQLPLSGDYNEYGVFFESSADATLQGASPAFCYVVSDGYFETMRIPLRRGRLLDARDRAGVAPAVVLSESLAKKVPGSNPIGQRVRIGGAEMAQYTIVGVVGDVKQMSLAANRADAAYITVAQWPYADSALSLVVRGLDDPEALVPALKRAIWSVDKDQPIARVTTLDRLVAASAAERRFALVLFEAFALVALALAAVGIYGVLSGSVTERTREIGVRSALGASRRDIVGLVLRQGMTLTGMGIAIGVGAAVAASRALVTLLFGTTRLDPMTYAGMIGLLVGVSALACLVPALRAARVDPSVTLRAE